MALAQFIKYEENAFSNRTFVREGITICAEYFPAITLYNLISQVNCSGTEPPL